MLDRKNFSFTKLNNKKTTYCQRKVISRVTQPIPVTVLLLSLLTFIVFSSSLSISVEAQSFGPSDISCLFEPWPTNPTGHWPCKEFWGFLNKAYPVVDVRNSSINAGDLHNKILGDILTQKRLLSNPLVVSDLFQKDLKILLNQGAINLTEQAQLNKILIVGKNTTEPSQLINELTKINNNLVNGNASSPAIVISSIALKSATFWKEKFGEEFFSSSSWWDDVVGGLEGCVAAIRNGDGPSGCVKEGVRSAVLASST